MSLYANRYEEIKLLGKGATGQVLLVLDKKSGLECALKIFIASSNQVVQSNLESFQSEFDILKNLNHPSIAKVYDAGIAEYEIETSGGQKQKKEFYISTEYVAGKSLSDAAENFSVEAIESLFVQALRALNYLQNQKVNHLDIKPPNILITTDESNEPLLKIIDFGFANFYTRGKTQARESWVIAGSSPYVSPEIIKGESPDARADLYSLACTFYDALTEQPPFTAMSHEEYHEKHLHEKPRPPSTINPKIPLYLDQILLRLLEKEPSKRFPSAQAVIEELNLVSGKFYPIETPKTRFSYLPEKGELIGREKELAKFKEFFEDRFLKGSPEKKPYLIVKGGEGSGKTRFINECKSDSQKKFIHTLSWKDFMSMDPEENFLKPCFILGDDLKIDSQALELISSVYSSEPILVMLTTSENEIPVDQENIIELKDLDREQTRHYLTKATGLSQIPESILEIIFKHTHGNPLYLSEYVRALFEQGFLRDTYGAWSQQILEDLGTELEKTGTNEFIKKRLTNRLDSFKLNHACWQILSMMALIGKPYLKPTKKDIEEMSASIASDIEDELKQLVSLGILEIDPEHHYVLTNSLYKDIILSKIDAAEKADYCDFIADYYERQGANPDVILYYRGRGNGPLAIQSLFELAAKKREQMSYQDAKDNLQLLVDKNNLNDDSKLKALLELGEINIETGKYEEAEKCFLDVIAHYEKDSKSADLSLIKAYEKIGISYHRRQKLDLAATFYQRGLNLIQNRPEFLWMEVVLKSRWSRNELAAGKSDQAEKTFLETWQVWKNKLTDEEKVKTLSQDIDVFYFFKGEFAKAISFLEELVEVVARSPHSEAYPITLYKLGRAYLQSGDIKKADSNLELCLSIIKKRKTPHWIHLLYNELGNLSLKKQKLESALDFYQRAFDLARKSPQRIELEIIAYNRGHVLLKMKRHEEAQKYFNFVIKNLSNKTLQDKPQGDHFVLASLLGLGAIHRELNQVENAKKYYREAEGLLKKHEYLKDFLPYYQQEVSELSQFDVSK